MLTFRTLRTTKDALQWTVSLEERWPERETVRQHIVAQVAALAFPAPHLVELCVGAGSLAERLLTDFPQMTYTGFDSSDLVLSLAQERLAPFEGRARLIQADLNQAEWLKQLDPVQAIISLQSLHDLGDEENVSRIYEVARELLVPGGLLLNADLVIASGLEKKEQPGRCTIPRHLELLHSHGYAEVACTLAIGDFGCFVSRRK
jgi:predicted TPR repeat methyltransferase